MKKTILSAVVAFFAVGLFAFCATSFSLADEMKNIIPDPPEAVSAGNSATGVNIVWNGVENIAGYKIYRSEEGGDFSEIADIKGISLNSFTDKTAESGKIYNYCVSSYNAYNEGDAGEECEILCLKQPTLSSVKNNYYGIELKWEKSPDADGYFIYRKSGKAHKKIAKLKGEDILSFIDENVEDGKKYIYRVSSFKDMYTSSSNKKTSDAFVTAPRLKKISNGNGHIKFSWGQVPGADGYIVYRKTGSSTWVKLAAVQKDELYFKDDSVKNGVNYTYSVKAVKAGVQSGYDKEGLSLQYIIAPTLKSAVNSENSILVKWKAVSGAEGYIVYRNNASGGWTRLGKAATASLTDKKVENGKIYTYTVKAFNKEGVTGGYNSEGVSCLCLKKPEGFKATLSAEGITLSWKKSSTADKYIIYRKNASAAEWKKLGAVGGATTSYTDKALKEGLKYYYTIRQVSGEVKGSYDKDGLKISYVKAPNLNLKHSPSGVVLSWNKSPVAVGYSIEQKTAGTSWKTVATITSGEAESYTHKTPAFGKLNYYRVRVVASEDLSLVSTAKSIYGIDPKKPMVALTYDDGPYSPVTNRILDTLEKYNARATFFIVGSRVSAYEDCLRRSVSLGCEIGNHTYNHTILTSVGADRIKQEIASTNNAVKKVTGIAPVVVRTPGGAVNSTVRSVVEYPLFNWSVDTLDWKYRNASSVVSSVKGSVRDGSIVLMHDLYESTASATEQFVPWLVKEGYQLVTVSELMAVKGIETKAGQLYTCGY